MSHPPDNIIFFDGDCGLCNYFVSLLIKKDTKHKLVFTPLQGKTAQSLLENFKDLPDSVIFLKNNRVYIKSDAVISALVEIGSVWKVIKVLLLIPKPIRNWIYDFIAQNRHRIFSTKNRCEVMQSQNKKYFLP